MIQALVFDLDDTLYPEVDFISGGYCAVARYVSHRYGGDWEEIYCAMMCSYANYGRGSVLPMVVKRFLDSSVPLQELVEVYREHLPQVRLFPGYECLLQRLGRDYRLGLISDGNPEVQRRKVQALGIENLLDKIIYTREYGPDKGKPHPLTFSLMLEYLRTEPSAAVYIGDNPDRDCRGAHSVGMKYAQLTPPRTDTGTWISAESSEQPDFVIHSLYQLTSVLGQMEPECDTGKS